VAEDFDTALAMLHHMQYEESRTAFERIVAVEPDCSMAHWGIAMTLFQPLWPSRPEPEGLQRGWEAVNQAQELGVETEREADLVAATAAFFREPESAPWWTRIQRWSEAMNQAYAARPDDIETAAFYALSQLAVGQTQPDRMAYHNRAATVLLDIYERQPQHPGAIHYTIHANDVDARAGESLEIVRSYGLIAPEVPHALHMPTHIFVRLGAWPEVIEWNLKSAAAALKHPAATGISHHYPHALDYLVYAYLQRGEDEQARALVEEVLEQEEPFQGTFISAFHLAAMPARYAVERRAWDEARAITPRMPASLAWDRFWWAESLSWFAQGLGALHSGEMAVAEQAEARMTALRDAAQAAGEETFADYIEIDRLVLAAWLAHRVGESEEALELAREAVQLESTTQKSGSAQFDWLTRPWLRGFMPI
jgi:tetratricopeptide (TPR) repeat protein